jgi:hypothetical protein
VQYLYWPVAGASVFWREPYGLHKAKAAIPGLRKQWPEAEVERVKLFNNNSRRYWRWRNGKWSTENHYDPSPADLEKWGATMTRSADVPETDGRE